MKKIYLFPICIIACSLLFNGCDEDEDNKLFLLLAGRALMGNPVNKITFNTHTEYRLSDFTEIEKDVTMTSVDGFVLSGGSYTAEFSYGDETFEISLPDSVTGTSTYTASNFAEGFNSTYTIIVDEEYPYGQWIFYDGGAPTNFELQVTSLSGGRITANFSGILWCGNPETTYANSSIVGGTLSSSIGD